MNQRTRRAFTIIELLVVIAIISILVTLGLVVARKVSSSGKRTVTEQTLRILDSTLSTYINDTGGNPPPTVADPRPGGNSRLIPIVDGRNYTNGPPPKDEFINSVGLFMLQCKSVPSAQAQLRDLDTKIVREFDADGADANPQSPDFAKQPSLTTAFDGWGNPIRYVHPAFKGAVVGNPNPTAGPPPSTLAQDRTVADVLGAPPAGRVYAISRIRRAGNGNDWRVPVPPALPEPLDADEGVPLSNRPYFYSCGPDGDPDWGAIPQYGAASSPYAGPVKPNDNIYYPQEPRFPKR